MVELSPARSLKYSAPALSVPGAVPLISCTDPARQLPKQPGPAVGPDVGPPDANAGAIIEPNMIATVPVVNKTFLIFFI